MHLVPQDIHVSGITAEPWLPGSGVRRAGAAATWPRAGGLGPCPAAPVSRLDTRATAVRSAGSTRPWPCSQAPGQPLLTAPPHLLPSYCRPRSQSGRCLSSASSGPGPAAWSHFILGGAWGEQVSLSPFPGRETEASERLSETQGWWTARPGFKLLSLHPQGTWRPILLRVLQETEPTVCEYRIIFRN